MATSSLSEEISIAPEQKSESINECEDKANMIIICFDPNNELKNNIQHFKLRLHQINNYVVFHNEIESCITFIRSIDNMDLTRHSKWEGRNGTQYGFSSHFWYLWSQISKVGTLCKRIANPPVMPRNGKVKIFLVIPYSYASEILAHITTLDQVAYVFIFCLKNDQYEHSLLQHPKIIGIYNKVDSLCSSIEEQIDLVDKQFHTWSFFDQHECATKDLSKQSSDFLWLQLLHEVLFHSLHDERAKEQMIDACRHYCRANHKELILIDEFEHEYQSTEALRWYLKSSFLRKMINEAFITENTDQLYKLRYFLGDLVENLNREHRQIIQYEREVLVVYQEVKLWRSELNKLKKNKGKLISMKGFLTASHARSS